ncbi:TetR/AcrR family transcriptional regulator [Nocardia cyriacigeorgica]|uniref:TetR/AcrR family transcriptional regulator n=1 Tax=Nocardia cyriacigeorgica TaxID=135487 RepID=UPI002453DDB8|nr:TetR/AcrR family transcriptional regulator [Nocardia cyriacigeorgica]
MTVLTEGAPDRLPHGPHRLTREEVENSQYLRLCAAALEAVGELGYAQTTVTEIVGRARVARRTFYALFGGKEECFAAAYDNAVADCLRKLTETIASSQDTAFADRVHSSFRVFLEILAAQPAATRALYIEILAAGPTLMQHRARVHRLFAEHIMAVGRIGFERGEIPAEPEPELIDMLLGGISDRIVACLSERGATHLPELAPLFTRTALILCGGLHP